MEASTMFLIRRTNGVWYFRRPVPKHLQRFLNSGNKREINYSLKSKVLDSATRRLHHDYLLESERLLEEVQKRADASSLLAPVAVMQNPPSDSVKPRPATVFSGAELDAIFQSWFLDAQTETLESARITFHHGDTQEREAALDDVEAKLSSLQRRLGALPSPLVMARVRSLVEGAGGFIPYLQIGEGMLKVSELEARVREGMIRLAMLEKDILTTGLLPKLESPPACLEPVQLSAAIVAKSVTLNELISRFENDPSRSVTPKTKDEFQIVFRTLREIIGAETPVASISREQMKALQAICLKLPSNFMRHYPGKPLKEVPKLSEADGRPPMSRATFNKRMTLMGSVFSYAVREQILPSSPAQGLTVESESANPGGKSFTIDQLNRIFSGPVFRSFAEDGNARFSPGHASGPHQFWTPLIGLFHGMREEEILQLGPQDVEEIDGVPCLKIGLRKGQQVKTKQSKRTIPIHPKLIELGFLQFVEAAKAAKLEDLFTDASKGKTYGNRSHNYSKRFNRYLKDVGVKTSRDQCFVSH